MADSESLRDRLRACVETAAGDRVAVAAYRGALAALDGLDSDDAVTQRAVVQAHVLRRRKAADDCAGDGRPTEALRLWAEADLLQGLLAE
jgi:hypothetical protein